MCSAHTIARLPCARARTSISRNVVPALRTDTRAYQSKAFSPLSGAISTGGSQTPPWMKTPPGNWTAGLSCLHNSYLSVRTCIVDLSFRFVWLTSHNLTLPNLSLHIVFWNIFLFIIFLFIHHSVFLIYV